MGMINSRLVIPGIYKEAVLASTVSLAAKGYVLPPRVPTFGKD